MYPNILILASGKGTRIQTLSNGLNKALVPIGNKATLSYIIEKFPKGSHIYITLGYLGDQVRDFCLLAYPDYEFTFIPVPDYEGPESGPGKSTLYAEPYLQSPFYLCLCDCIVEEDIDFEDNSNWIGVQETRQPEIYSTALTRSGQVLDFKNKDVNGYPDAFIGLAHIRSPHIFWKELRKRMVSGELVEVFKGYEALDLKARHFTWHDTGNLESLQETRNSLCIEKNTGENLYHEGSRCIKYFPNIEKVQDLYVRGKLLGTRVPENLEIRGNFIAYDWIEGENLYEVKDFQKALETLFFVYDTTQISSVPSSFSLSFYRDKTLERVGKFLSVYGQKYGNWSFSIGGHFYQPLQKLLELIDWKDVCSKVKPFLGFHGDFQPSNLVLQTEDSTVKYIDWRDSFGGFLGGGDLYYELGKFLGGLEVNYDLVKDDSILDFRENGEQITWRGVEPEDTSDFWKKVENRNLDTNHIKLIRCLVQLSMCPLHTEKLGKYLWFRSIQNLEIWAKREGKL